MFSKKGKDLHRVPRQSRGAGELEQAIAAALKAELGSTHQAIKTVMRWTGASERTVKHWFAGTYAPSVPHLVSLARNSDAVLTYFLSAADRRSLSVGIQLITLRMKLIELITAIDTYEPN